MNGVARGLTLQNKSIIYSLTWSSNSGCVSNMVSSRLNFNKVRFVISQIAGISDLTGSLIFADVLHDLDIS